jgi:hypothetical protein
MNCQSSEIAIGACATAFWSVYIEKLNGPFLFGGQGTPAEYSTGLDRAISRGWLVMHESGTYVKFTPAGAELFA